MESKKKVTDKPQAAYGGACYIPWSTFNYDMKMFLFMQCTL